MRRFVCAWRFDGYEKTGSWEGKGVKQTYTGFSSGITYTRVFQGYDETIWEEWKQISTTTSPQRYDLPLNDGFSANGTCKYFKIQENIVNLSGGVSGSFPSNQDTQIGILPEGFRPSGTCRRDAVANASTAYIEIRADGSVWIHPFNSAGAYAFFNADFIAIS